MRKELFESEDVVIGESDHGLSRLTENQPKKAGEAGLKI